MNPTDTLEPLPNEEAIARIARAVPDMTRMPTLDEMNARTRKLAGSGRARVRQVGASRMGERIDLVSLGSGPRNVLFVGTPHPNEAIGCLTIEYLIARLADDASLRDEVGPGWTWHFIKSIEPDGLRLNEGWLARPHDRAAYLRHVFRPAAAEQAEYTFPLDAHGYRFDACTPENRAWQAAFETTRPDLLVSLHNCEHGGCYYAVSRDLPALTRRLAAQPAEVGMPVIAQDEGFDEHGSLAPGVYGAFDIEALLADWSRQSGTGPAPWHAGQSSFGHGATRGTFGLIVEAPHWVEARSDWQGAPDVALNVLHAQAARWFEDTVRLVDRHLEAVRHAPHSATPRLVAAARDFRDSAEGAICSLRQASGAVLGAHDAAMQRRVIRLRQLRPIAMLSRLAGWAVYQGEVDSAARLAFSETTNYLEDALGDAILADGMRPMPLKTSVALQVRAALTAMACLD